MRVWSQLSSPNRQYFKRFILHQPTTILQYLTYLTTLNEISHNSQNNTPFSQNTSKLNSSKGKIESGVLVNLQTKNGQQSSNSMNIKRFGDQIIEVTTEDGKIQKLPIRNILPITNLSLLLKAKSFDPGTHLLIDRKLLGSLREEILEKCHSIPITYLVTTPPNILKMIEQKTQQSSKEQKTQQSSKGQKRLRRQQTRSLMYSINDKFYLQLVNQDIAMKQLNFETIENSYYSKELKKLYQYYERKIQQLLINKELTVVTMYVLGGEFYSSQNYFQQSHSTKRYFPLCSQKYVYSFFNFIQQRKHKFWPYQTLSLQSIVTLIDIFFDKTQYKLSFYFDDRTQAVQKIEIKPFARFVDHLVGMGFTQMLMKTENNSQINNFPLKGNIFDILINSSPQMKTYYKIPQFKSNRSPKVTLQDLIETMSQIGFKISEISSIMRNFSLIMNIFLLEVQEKQEKMNKFSTFQNGLAENIGYKNILSLYSDQLELIQSILLNEEANNIELSQQSNKSSTTGIKKQILASILWQLAIARLANQINSKIQKGGNDLSKTKRFDIYCHRNSSNGQPDSGNFFEEATLQESEYQIVGRKLVEKEFEIQKINLHQLKLSRNKVKLSEKNHRVDSSLSFRNQIHSSYLQNLQKSFTSFNAQFINPRRMSFRLYNFIKSLQEIKRMGAEAFNLLQISETSEKYWKEFFEGSCLEEEGKLIENNYFMCGDYHHFINQQKQGKELLRFFGKIIESSIEQQIRNHKQVDLLKKSQNSDQNLLNQKQLNKKTNLGSPRNQITNTNFPLGSPTNQVSQEPQGKGNLFFDTENLSQSELKGTSSSMIKTPHQLRFSIELPHLVTKYLYGQEFKEMHRILISMSKQFTNKVIPYDSSKIYQIVQEIIIQISQFREEPLPAKKYKKILQASLDNNNINKLLHLPFFELFYDDHKQSYYIEATQDLLFKIQRQSRLQKQAIQKIITLFRAYKFRKNHSIFMFRKKFLKTIHKLCKLTNFAKTTLHIIYKKKLTLLKASYDKLKLKFCIEKLIKCTKEIYKKSKENLLHHSFGKIKNLQNIQIDCKKMNPAQQQINLPQQNLSINQFQPNQYSLTVTSPSGKIKNLDDKSHKSNDIQITNSDNINVGKLLQKKNDKKPVVKENPIQEDTKSFRKESEPKSSTKKQIIERCEIIPQQLSNQPSNIKNKPTDQQKIRSKPQQSNNSHVSNQVQVILPIKITQGSIKKPQILNQQPLEQKIQKQLPKIPQKKQQINGLQKSKVSELSNEVVSIFNGGMSGSLVSCRSQHSEKLTKMQLFTLKDSPFFSFESWSKQTRTVHPEGGGTKPNPVLFRKLEAQKIKPNQQRQGQVSEDTTLKQKIINGSFVGYLKQSLNKGEKQSVEEICFYQKKPIQKPLLKDYSIQKHGSFYKDTFNHILKLSLFKNTSKKLFELLNSLIKPIRDAYRQQKSAQQTVFEDEPLIINSYDSVYNLYRDEMFLQFAKQIMGNKDQPSLRSLTFVLEIITKNYHPSPKFFYPFLNFIKTNQLTKPQLYSKIYENLIKFAQAIEGYKGLHVHLSKEQPYVLTQNQYHQYLEPRQSQFIDEECKLLANKITVGLFNGQKYEFIVRNQTLKSIKKRMVYQLGFGKYENNFGLYEQRGQKNYLMIREKQKAIDYLAGTYPNKQKLVLRVGQYYPIKFTDINSLRMFYLNQISEQCRLPFKAQDYQHIVALGISFDEFQQTRIGNFMLLKKQKLKDQDLKGIKSKLQKYVQVQREKRICEFQYFKTIKEFNMLLAKSYRVPKEKEKYFEQIDKIIIKPKQLCFYSSTLMKSSLSLYRIKSFYFQNQQIHIELIYSDRDLGDGHDKKFHGVVKSLTLKGFVKIAELYEDIVYYTELLQLGKIK